MSSEKGRWLALQVTASANRLLSSSPSLLSPTGRSLRDDAAAWVAAVTAGAQPKQKSPELTVVKETSKRGAAKHTQLPLMG
jgi:hypothetical protein